MHETIKYMCRVSMWLNTCLCLVLRVMPLVNIEANEKEIKKINKIEYNGFDRNITLSFRLNCPQFISR
jgi:hypothetical protein